jgi:hypothetical protein
MKMKLAKALKEKNRLVGDICRIKNLIQRENSRNVKSTAKTDRAALWKELADTTGRLVALKAAIFRANAGIYEKIVMMAELKSKATWITSLNTTDGVIETPNYHGEGVTTETFDAFLKQEDIDKMTVDLQTAIADLQDEIDEYNATVTVEV